MYSSGPLHMAVQKVGQPARTYVQQLGEDTVCSPVGPTGSDER